jgi:cyclic pyranopterin phosphate synthase
MPEKGVQKLRHEDILSVEEIGAIIRAAAKCGITKVRVTGGEPLVRRGIIDIIREVAAVPGIRETCLTTNGTLLPEYAAELRAAGVARVNISLDSLKEDVYRSVTRVGELGVALRGLDAALQCGFERVKVNAVLIGDVNDGEIRELIGLTRRGVHVRFIELMPIGECSDWNRGRFLGGGAVLLAAPELIPCGTEGVAALYKMPGADGTVGLISPVSSHFCGTCDRIRVTADGRLKPCLHSPDEIPLRELRGAALEDAIRRAILGKPSGHALSRGASESLRGMNAIGG